MTKICAIYARSSAAKAEFAQNLQIERCAVLATRCGDEISATYADSGVAASAGKPELRRLLADCVAGQIDTIYVSSRDRISRNLDDFLSFMSITQKHDVQVLFLEDAV